MKLKKTVLELAASAITSLPYTKVSSRFVDKITVAIEREDVK